MNDQQTKKPRYSLQSSAIRNNMSFTGEESSYDLTDSENLRQQVKMKRDAKRSAKQSEKFDKVCRKVCPLKK